MKYNNIEFNTYFKNHPDAVVACVGGGSNAMGLFSGFLNDPVDIYGVGLSAEILKWATMLQALPMARKVLCTDLIQ